LASHNSKIEIWHLINEDKMKRILLATVAMAALGSASALAADLSQRPIYKAEPVMMAPTWTGCYIGGNVGGAFGNASATDNITGASISGNGSGFAGGGQIGCDYEFGGGFVIGARELLDYTSNSKSGTIATGPLTNTVVNFNNQWFDTLTGRLGYAVQPNWLLYFQGGAAWAHTSTNFSGPLISGQVSNSRTGWTIGGGVEWMFAPHWSAFLEGNYMDFGSNSGNVTFSTVPVPVTVKATESTVLVGVNYHFF
jgi:outer membrane immunogenic protein